MFMNKSAPEFVGLIIEWKQSTHSDGNVWL